MWRQYWSTGVRSIGSAATITLEDIVIELAKTTDEMDKVYNHVQIFNLGVKWILLLSASSFFAFHPVWFSNLFRRCIGFVFVLINSFIGALLHSTDVHIILCLYIYFWSMSWYIADERFIIWILDSIASTHSIAMSMHAITGPREFVW